MARKALLYGTVLIGMYLVGGKATQWGRLLQSGAGAGRTVIRSFQGK